jgi:hypothetical protein
VNRLIASSCAALLVVTVAACGDGDDGALPLRSSDISIPDLSIPSDLSIPDLSIPTDFSIPENLEVTDEMIDSIISSIEQAGVNVDRECVADALEGVDLADLAEEAQSMGPEFIQQFIACVTP